MYTGRPKLLLTRSQKPWTSEFDVAGTSVEHGMSKQMNDQIDQACRSVWSGDVKITGGSNEKSGGKK